MIALASLAIACQPGSDRCVAGMTIACACLGGGSGVQTCQADGTYQACQCLDGGGLDGGGLDGGVDAAPTSDTGEVADAPNGDGGAPDAGDPCAGHVIYAGAITSASSVWALLPTASGNTGYEAGVAACTSIGADHPCDYEEMVAAAAAGEFSTIPAATTAWVHRTTTASVDGTDSPPGPGGRCNDWTFAGNHLADGEYVSFDVAGVPTYHLDGDTVFDPSSPGVHVVAGLDCAGVTRSILCCYPRCMP
jgi:hypothetical protein